MTKRKIKWKNLFLIVIIFICLVFFCYSIFDILKWKFDTKEIENQVENIHDVVEIKEIEDNDDTEIIIQDASIPKENPYWDYIKMNLIDVKFDELLKINSSVKGWIQVNGTNINYPFVQHSDNSFYLNHSFDDSYNDAGWVFLDYRNDSEILDQNTIIYAHSRLDESMFGSLKKILKNGWLDKEDNHVIKLSTLKENTLWQVFSIYHIPTSSDYLRINFNSNDDFNSWNSMIIDRSLHDFKTTVSTNDKILTLSTCYGKDEKLVVHAKLIKKEIRH